MQCHARLAGAVLLLSRAALAHAPMPSRQSWAADAGPLRPGGSRYRLRRARRKGRRCAAAAGMRRLSPLPRAGFAVAGRGWSR